jgi:hypothetical protein
MQRIRAGERTVCFDSSKYPVEEPEYLWDSGAVACQSPRLKLWWVGRSAFILTRYSALFTRKIKSGRRATTKAVAVLWTTETRANAQRCVVRFRDGPLRHRCAAAHCWNHDCGRYALLPSTIVREIPAPAIGIPLAPVNFDSSAPLLLRVQRASDQRKPRHIERNLQAYRGTNKIVTVAAVSRSRYPMSRALRSNTGTS